MPHTDIPSSLEPRAATQAWHRAIGRALWRLSWVFASAGWVSFLPASPAKVPALALLVASALVLHADAIARPIRRRLASRG